MLRPARTLRRNRPETKAFREVLRALRNELGWSQLKLALRLNVSKRTLSNWENGYWLPPFKERLHIVVALRDVPPEYVLAIADALGVSADEAVEPLLQRYHDALDPPEEPPPPPPAPEPPPQPAPPPLPSLEALHAVVDPLVRDSADAMNVSANEVRAAIGRVLAACAELGGNLELVQKSVVLKVRARKPA
jgi:transcriptional regulator with XRE-family HTH domain